MASSIINSDDGSVSGTTGLKTTGGDDGALEIQSVGTKYMTVAAGGDISFYEDTGTTAKFYWDASAESLGIGITPETTLHINRDVSTTYSESNTLTATEVLKIANRDTTAGTAATILFNARGGGGGNGLATISAIATGTGSNALGFGTRNAGGNVTERMRIDSSGRLLVAATSSFGNGGVVQIDATAYGSNLNGLNVKSGVSSYAIVSYAASQQHIYFTEDGSAAVGNITSNGSSTSYNTTSDYRLKEDWQPMSGSIDRLKALNPVNFAWKADGSRVDGFLAHEAAEVVPEAVTGEKDAVEAIGNVTDAEGTVVQENVLEPAELAEGQTWTKTEDRPVYQGIDQAKLVPLLTAALQEAVSKIEALETRIAALEA